MKLLIIAALFISGFSSYGFGSPTEILRVTPDMIEWCRERDLLADCFQKDLVPASESKILPLLIAVRLGLTDSVEERGVSLVEFAIIYSETKKDDGKLRRQLTAFSRPPYQNRKWYTEKTVSIEEGSSGGVSSVLVLKDSDDVYKELSAFVKRTTAPVGARDYIITVVAFEKELLEAGGKEVDDAALIKMVSQNRPESETVE